MKLRDLLRRLIDKILVYPVGKGKEQSRIYKIKFKGGSARTLIPDSPHVLARDWDKEKDLTQYWYNHPEKGYIFKERRFISLD